MKNRFLRYAPMLLTGLILVGVITGLVAASTRAAEVVDMPLQVQVEPENQPAPPAAGRQIASRQLLVRVLVRSTAEVAGIDVSEVQARLADGQSLAQIAEDHGKTAADVVSAAVNKSRSRIDQAVQAGRLSQEQADQMIITLTTRANDLVHHSDLGQRINRRQQQSNRAGVKMSLVKTTADLCGLPVSEVVQRMRNGESLAQIAASAGQSGDAVVDAAVEQFRNQASQVINETR